MSKENIVANHLYLEDDPGPAERLVFDLAIEIQKSSGYTTDLAESQQEALNYINTHGINSALSYLENLRERN